MAHIQITDLPTASTAQMADPTSAINQLGAHRSRPDQIAMCTSWSFLYISKNMGGPWVPSGYKMAGAKLPTIIPGE